MARIEEEASSLMTQKHLVVSFRFPRTVPVIRTSWAIHLYSQINNKKMMGFDQEAVFVAVLIDCM